MGIVYIKANGEYYRPQEAGSQDPKCIEGCFLGVCYIKKLLFGRWEIRYYDGLYADWENGVSFDANQTPNTKLILYPSGIEEIRYKWKTTTI